ncbi:hypothetical protein HDV63DRAFT_56231 [Trichoderma sp. SZMC 28014]
MACSVTGKDKVGPAKRCSFWVFVCVYVFRREKEEGRRNEYFTPSFSFTCFPFFFSHPLTLSFICFFKGSHVVMKSFWLEKHSTHSFKITEMKRMKSKKTGGMKGIFFSFLFLSLWMEFLLFYTRYR